MLLLLLQLLLQLLPLLLRWQSCKARVETISAVAVYVLSVAEATLIMGRRMPVGDSEMSE